MTHISIDEKYWRNNLSKPDWYNLLYDDFLRIEKASEKLSLEQRTELKQQLYGLVEEGLVAGIIPLADRGKNFDKEREAVDTIIIHHTKNHSGMTLNRLNAMHLLRIYAPHYVKSSSQPVWSGHYYKGQQVFWTYHWLIRVNGQLEHILNDNHIGWHAGNWEINTRSIAICIDDDLSQKSPNDKTIIALTKLIKKHYPSIEIANIKGHLEVNPKTECPGSLFIKDWKSKLIVTAQKL